MKHELYTFARNVLQKELLCKNVYNFITTDSSMQQHIGREVKLICLPSDNMGDRGHIKMIIYIYYAIYTDN